MTAAASPALAADLDAGLRRRTSADSRRSTSSNACSCPALTSRDSTRVTAPAASAASASAAVGRAGALGSMMSDSDAAAPPPVTPLWRSGKDPVTRTSSQMNRRALAQVRTEPALAAKPGQATGS
jgi:hypothetical protein